MKKTIIVTIALFLILAAISALLLVGNTNVPPANGQPEKPAESTQTAGFSDAPLAVTEEETPALESTTTLAPTVPVVEIALNNYYQTTSQCFFNGNVKQDSTALQTGFDIYCAGTKVGTGSTKSDGTFSFIVSKGKCAEGVDAWIVASGKESAHIDIHYNTNSGSGGSSVQSFSISRVQEPAGVPEFSIMTLGLAVVIGGLGLAYLRKE